MKCVVIDKDYGILFRIMDLNDGKPPVIMFTKDHESKYVVDKVPIFTNALVAESFVRTYIGGNSGEYVIYPLEKEPKDPTYATYKELMDNGLSDHVGYMIDSLIYPTKTMQ